MKKHLMLLLASLGALSLAGAFAACQQEPPTESNSSRATTISSTGTASATPAITYVGSRTIKKNAYPTIAVMDSDGTHQTDLFTFGSTFTNVGYPTWSPQGSSIVFESYTGGIPDTIKALDVSVNSNGVPVASNIRNIYATSTSDSFKLQRPAWCSVSTTGKIAFIRCHANNSRLMELCTVSESGGTPTVLISEQHVVNGVTKLHYNQIAWSPDDSKIAIVRTDTTSTEILIVDASNGNKLDSVALSLVTVGPLEWSRTGTNSLAFSARANTSSPLEIYYCTPSTGSTPTTNSVQVNSGLSWSPNNSSVLFANSNQLKKVTSFTSNSSTVLSSFSTDEGWLRWKR